MKNTITAKELAKIINNNDNVYNELVIVDIRQEMSFNYGHIKNAINVTDEKIKEEFDTVYAKMFEGKRVVVYCKKGEISGAVVDWLDAKGVNAIDLIGGYVAWLVEGSNQDDEEDDSFYLEVEKSIRKKFHKKIWCNFTKAIKEYKLVNEGDKIAVCISGGKDSMLMAKLFQELKLHNKVNFELEFLVMNPGYSPENMAIIENNAKKLHIPIKVFNSDIFDSVYQVEKSPCYLCARMRRGYLYSHAKALGCNKIALGHHYDDVIETILMGMLYGAQIQTMMPKLYSTNFEGMELIRPMYLIREEQIKAWRDYNGLGFIQCACRFTDSCTTCDNGGVTSKRQEIKQLIARLKEVNPFVEGNIFKSVENISLNTVIAFKDMNGKHHFLDYYDDEDYLSKAPVMGRKTENKSED